MVGNFKGLLADIEVNCGFEASMEVREEREKVLERAEKEVKNQDEVFEVFYKILQPKFEDVVLELDQFKEEKEELTT